MHWEDRGKAGLDTISTETDALKQSPYALGDHHN